VEVKESSKEGKKSKKSVNIFRAALVLLAVIILVFFIFKPFAPKGNYDEFANCLTSKNVIFYGTNWCPTCKEQKKLFGNSLDLIDFRNCDELKDECAAVGVVNLPTWLINGEKHTGFLTFENLSTVSGCVFQAS